MTKFWVELVCLNCAKTHEGQFVRTAIPKIKMKRAAKKSGWIFSESDNFCCQDCYDEFQIEKSNG